MWKTELPLIAILARLVGVIFDCDVYQTVGLFVLLCTVVAPASGQTPVLTQHNDNARTGQNTSETILTTANVNTSQFGKLFALPVDGQVYAQPLYVPGVTINGGVHNVLIIATENDSVYAYDADSASAVLLWKTKASLVDAAHGAGAGETALETATTTGCSDMQPQIGITSTPVIDPTSKTIYVEAKSTNGTNYFHRLHALDLLTGNEKTPGPVVITATVSGTGDGSSNGQLSFDNLHQLNRPGLLLLNGTIYMGYASHCDGGPYHGWLFAYDEATFARKSVYVTTPNGGLGGFWMSGAGVAADASGNIFIPSGNGTFDNTKAPVETGDTILKLGTTNQILTLLDYFTPEEQATMDSHDEDLGSGGVLLLPDQPGSFPHILVEAGKEGRIYVVNRDQMTTNNSHYCSGCPNDPEIIEESGLPAVGAGGYGMFNTAAYWNNTLYFWGVSDVLKSIPITSGLPDFTHVTRSTPQIGFPGAGVSVSSNGTTAGSAIVWAIDSSQYGSPGPGPGPAVLYAYDATNISKMLYSSAQNATHDAAGSAVKFAVPTVANGKVYVGTSTEVDVYGLFSNSSLNISSITPSSVTVGGTAFPLTINGTGFITGATVNFGSNPAITPSSVTSTQIVATIPAADIATLGTVNVTVTNPTGGGTSNARTFTISIPANVNACTATSCAVNLTSTNAGDLIVLGLFVLDSTSVSSVTDTQGNTYTLIGSPQTWSPYHFVERLYYAKNIKGGANTTTVTLSGSKYMEVHLYDYSGLDTSSPLDASATPQTGTSVTGTSGTLTTSNANDLLFGFFHSDNNVTSTAGSGFTGRTLSGDGGYPLAEDEYVTSTNSYSATMSFSGSADYVGFLVAFKAASGTPPAPGTPTYTNISTTSLTVNWTISAGATSYNVYRSTSSNGTYSQIGTTSTSSYGDTGLTPNTTYWYKVAGTNATGTGPQSASSSVTTLTAAFTPAYVTGNTNACTATTCAVNLTGTNAGDLIVLGLFVLDSTSVNSVNDTQGNTYTLIGSPQTWSPYHFVERLYYAKNIKGGANTTTVTLSGSKYMEVHLYDYSGLDTSSPLDASATPQTGTSVTGTSGTLTTSNANDLLFGFFHSDNNVTNTAGSGFTGRTLSGDGGYPLAEDEYVTSTNSYSATMSFSGSADYVGFLVAFKAAAR